MLFRNKSLPLTLFIVFGVFYYTHAQSPVPDGASLELIRDGFSLSEGPYWHPDGYLLFSDVSQSWIYRWDAENGVQSFVFPSGETNGITGDRFKQVLVAQHDARRIARKGSGSGFTTLADNYQGKKLHSPNDLAVKSDGAVFFTDPPWGGNPSELDFHGVYRIPPGGGDLQLLVDSLQYPNGIAFSPDESKLYIAETNSSDIYVYDVVDDSTLANGSVFVTVNEYGNADQNSADGIKVDNDGNLWATGSEGVAIFNPDGDLLDIINVPGSTTNLNWGGTDTLMLFITNFSGLYKMDLGVLTRLSPPTDLEVVKGENQNSLTWEVDPKSVKFISVYRKVNDGEFEQIDAMPFSDSYTDTDIAASEQYTYMVTVTDVLGFESEFSNQAGDLATALEQTQEVLGFELHQNYPNPFNPGTTIGFSLSKGGYTTLEVYSVNGQLVDVLLNKSLQAGYYEKRWEASGLASGLYIYILKSGGMQLHRKMLLLK